MSDIALCSAFNLFIIMSIVFILKAGLGKPKDKWYICIEADGRH